MDRLGFELNNVHDTATDICNEFKRCKISDIQNAISQGSLGKFGIDYRMSTQIVCVWIRKYLENKNKTLL